MTASPINAQPVPNAVAAPGAAKGLFGASQAAAGAQGPLAGFEALLAAFFGGQGQTEAGAPAVLGGAKSTDPGKATVDAQADAKDESKDAVAGAETPDTPIASADAQILAALLAQPILPPPTPSVGAPAQPAEAPQGGAAPQLPDPTALLAQAAKGAEADEIDAAKADAQADAGVSAKTEAGQTPTNAKAAVSSGPTAPGPTVNLAAAETPRAAAAPPPQTPPPATQAAPPPPVQAAAAAAAPASVAAPIAPAESAETAESALAVDETAPAPTPGHAKTAARAARNESGRADTGSQQGSAQNAGDTAQPATAVVQTAATFESGSESKPESKAPTVEAAAPADDARQPAPPAVGDLAATAATAAAPAEVRASPQTVVHLASQIVNKLEGRTTQFDVALNPEGLGKVDVRIEIGAQGRLTASMSFENPHAAAELRSRANELQKALEQAGFDISGGIRFDVAADRGQGQAGQGQFGQDTQNNGGAWRGRAFQAALDSAGETADAALSGALNLQRRTQSGVDVRI